jgi:hypothetical protein
MPGTSELPDSIKPLAFRNAAEVSPGRDFNVHMDRLIRSIEAILVKDSRFANAQIRASLIRASGEKYLDSLNAVLTEVTSAGRGESKNISHQPLIAPERSTPARIARTLRERPILALAGSAVLSGLCSYLALLYAVQFLAFSLFIALGLHREPTLTILPGGFFGLVICACNYRFGVKRWFFLLIAFIISVGSWIIAYDTTAHIVDNLSQYTKVPATAIAPQEQEAQGQANVPTPPVEHVPFLMGFSGLIGGFVGGLGIVLATWLVNPKFRKLQDITPCLFLATLFGGLLELVDPLKGDSFGYLALFLTWQPAVVVSIARALDKSSGSYTRPKS